MAEVVIQGGHLYRTSGATGGRDEQKIVEAIGRRVTSRAGGVRYALAEALLAKTAAIAGAMLTQHGHRVHFITADQAWTFGRVDAFIALHCDSSNSRLASGASVGYPSSGGQTLARAWKRAYARNGWSRGFRQDNYTAGLRGYYYYRRANAGQECVVEHGFTTNPTEYAWLTSTGGQRAACRAIVDAVGDVYGHPQTPEDEVTEQDIRDIAAHLLSRLADDNDVGAEAAREQIARTMLLRQRFNLYGAGEQSPESVNLATATARGAQHSWDALNILRADG